MARIDELRLMTKIARLYYDQDMTQPEIAAQLDLSQATVSRLLKRAKQEEIIRVTGQSTLEDAFVDLIGSREELVGI